METFFPPDSSVCMTQSMVIAAYEGQRTLMFIRGLLLTCTLIMTRMKYSDYEKNCYWNLSDLGHGAYILKFPVLIVAIRKIV